MENEMSATNELLENTPMRISMALNVALALGIALLLAAPDATSPSSGLRSVTPTGVAAGEAAVRDPAPVGREQRGRVKHEVVYAGQVRYPVPAGLERRGRVERAAATPAASSTIAPAVNDTSSASRARVRTR